MTDDTFSPAQPTPDAYSFSADYGKDLLTDINQAIHRGGTNALVQDCLKRCYREITRLRASQPSPAATVVSDTELQALRESSVQAAQTCNSYLQRALDAEDDALRLHHEKVDMYERAILAEAKLASHNSSSAGSEAIDPVRRAFRNADAQDWEHLSSLLGYGGHGKFWRHVFEEVREHLLHIQPQEAPTSDDVVNFNGRLVTWADIEIAVRGRNAALTRPQSESGK